MQKLQTILISILIIVSLFTSIYFPYKWKQLSNDFLDQTNQYGELLKQINDLQKEVRELRDGEGEIEKIPDENLEIGEEDESEKISDWKIYRNEEFGFEVKYPSKSQEPRKYNSEDSYFSKGIDILIPYVENEVEIGDPILKISVAENSSQLFIKEWVQEYLYSCYKMEPGKSPYWWDKKEIENILNSIEDFTLNDIKGVKIKFLPPLPPSAGNCEMIYIPRNSKVYSIGFCVYEAWSSFTPEIAEKEKEKEELILSTFKFIE